MKKKDVVNKNYEGSHKDISSTYPTFVSFNTKTKSCILFTYCAYAELFLFALISSFFLDEMRWRRHPLLCKA